MGELSPISYEMLSTPEGAEEKKKGGKKREEAVEESREKDSQEEHQKEHQKDLQSSEDDNEIALDQLDLAQKMIPEEPSLPPADEEEEEKKNEKQLQIEEPREVQRQEASRARKVGERKWGNPKETKPSTQRK